MKITNKYGLPQPLVTAVTGQKHDTEGADFSVTELILPPRIAALRNKHEDEIEEDASDRIWALMGSMGHEVLRKASQGGIVEQRCSIEFGGWKISGQMDYAVPDLSLLDYKFVSLWAIKDGVKPEWEQQLNVYKYMADQYGVTVNKLDIVAILRDWSKPEASRNPELPQSQVVVLPVRIWAKEAVEFFLRQRIEAHVKARKGELPNCTPEEMWERPERFAVMKKGNKRATRVLDDKLEAGKFIASQPSPNQFEIEVRPAERPRCELYCSVSAFCEQFKQWKGQHP